MRHMRTLGLSAALVLGLLLSPAAAQAPRNVVVQTVTAPPGLDLTATPASATAAVVFYNIQEALVKVDRHGKLVPWLAERWHTTDNRNYTFFLKRGVHFHNGREMTAADVKYVFERAMNPETKHPYPGYYAAIGDIDASLFGLGPEHVQELQKDARFQVIVGDTTNDVILATNNSRKPYADVGVRRAITYAIDKQDVLKGAMFGMGKILGSNVDPLNPYYIDVSGLMPYDPAKAKKLLAEAGYPNGFETVLKVAPQYYYTVRTGEIIVNHLAKVGVKVKIEQIEWGQWISRVWREADYDLTIIGHAEAWDIANYANPKYYFRYDSPEFQTLFKESEVTLDDKARRELYVKMQRKLVEDAPAVWLYMHPRLVVAKKGIQGIWKDLPVPSADLSEVAWAKY